MITLIEKLLIAIVIELGVFGFLGIGIKLVQLLFMDN